MKITEYENHKELLPDEGKVLTDGNGYALAVSMPLDADESVWIEVDEIVEETNEE